VSAVEVPAAGVVEAIVVDSGVVVGDSGFGDDGDEAPGVGLLASALLATDAELLVVPSWAPLGVGKVSARSLPVASLLAVSAATPPGWVVVACSDVGGTAVEVAMVGVVD